jgi:hypothetical protein
MKVRIVLIEGEGDAAVAALCALLGSEGGDGCRGALSEPSRQLASSLSDGSIGTPMSPQAGSGERGETKKRGSMSSTKIPAGKLAKNTRAAPSSPGTGLKGRGQQKIVEATPWGVLGMAEAEYRWRREDGTL